ncbi:lipase member H-B [Plutella xylostella]|uniref:lipase member H-B n=1 Tax=Plutella xylostella TaxID=51655 RepID=UPI002032A50C|nr:lipase member H-B [Plutella xylostella]
MVFLVKILFTLLMAHESFGMMSSKAMEGYPEGFLGNCPGSNKPAIITKKSLKYLGLVVLGDDSPQSPRKFRSRTYNYYQAKEIAKNPNWDFRRKTILFLGGYLDSPNFFVSQIMGKTYRKMGYNVLLMEANRFLTLHYPISARYVRPIGMHIAEMLTNLTQPGLMDLNKFELAGISLGGQLISFVAKNYHRITGNKIPRLTALDPSGPCFRNNDPENRLDDSDGDLVVVIETNIDGFGMAAPVGHVNFYVNGGEYQPADLYWIPCSVMCSHVRSYTIWYVALHHPKSFIGVKCDSVQEARKHACFGKTPLSTNNLSPYYVNASNPGIFYLATDNNYPYYLGEKGLNKDGEFWTKNLIYFNSEEVLKL